MCFAFLTNWLGWGPMSVQNDPHNYIHGVLQRNDHGPYRRISCDLTTLNDAIQQHAERIAQRIEADVKRAHSGDPDKVTLQNHLGNVSFKAVLRTPSNLNELVQLIAKAKQEKLNIKPVGGFYAFSPVCETTGYAIKTDKLVGTSLTPKDSLKTPYQEGLYDILCGTTFKQAIGALEKDGRALMNLGGFTGQGNIGATATGTHGSGLTIPPLASMIIGINLVSAQFDPKTNLPIQYRLEPSNGITNPKLHSGPWKLIQNDLEFNAAMTGLGAMGVVYSVTITTVPFYWVRELREIVDWPTAKALLEEGPQGGILKYHNAEVWVNPYTSQTLLTRREPTTTPPAAGELTEPTLSIHTTLLKELRALQTVMNHLLSWDTITDESEKQLGIILALFLREFALLVPSVMDLALMTQSHLQPKVGKYYEIYDIGFAHNFPAISTEISFPMTEYQYLRAAEATITLVKSLQKQDMYKAVLSPISLRFTASTPANLSMSYCVPTKSSAGRCYIEMPSLYYFYETIQTYDDISRPSSDQSVRMFQGRLHWGQYITPEFTTLQYKPGDADYYASITSFKAVAEKFDPGHMMANTFLNKVIWLVDGIV